MEQKNSPSQVTPTAGRRLVYILVICLMVLVTAEVAAYFASWHFGRLSFTLYYPHITESYEHYQARINPATGWPSRDFAKERPGFYDATGARLLPAFPDPAANPPCISLYGDSFIEGDGVDHEHAWSNVLSLMLGCRVANFGVVAYGTDQALLRYRHNLNDRAPLVILGHLDENIQRNVSQLRNLISYGKSCKMKPRFILDPQGNLRLVPIPSWSKEQYETLLQNPERVLSHDYFVPGGPSGFQKAQFPYIWGLMQVSGLLFRNLVFLHYPYYDLYRPGHPSQALEITGAILAEFCRLARERGQHPLVLLIPSYPAVRTYQRHQEWVYQPLLNRLTERRLEVIDAGPRIIQYLNGANPHTIYDPKINLHFNDKGNALLAHIVYDYLTKNNLLRHDSP